MNQTEFLTVNELADVLKCKPGKIYRLLNSGELPGVKFGHTWRIRRSDLEQYLISNSNRQARA